MTSRVWVDARSEGAQLADQLRATVAIVYDAPPELEFRFAGKWTAVHTSGKRQLSL